MSPKKILIALAALAIGTALWKVRSSNCTHSESGGGKQRDQSITSQNVSGDPLLPLANPNRFFERGTRSKSLSINSMRTEPVTWMPGYDGKDSWFSDRVGFNEARTNSITHKGRTVTLVTDRIVNTNGVVSYLEGEAQLELETNQRAASFSNLFRNANATMTKSDIIRLVGTEPAKAARTTRFDYIAFSTHPEGKLPAGLIENWPLAFVFFDKHGKFEKWELVLQRAVN